MDAVALNSPEVSECPGIADNWVVTEEFIFKRFGILLTIARGFVTDLASIQRLFWLVIAPFELGITGPVVHDWLYRSKGQTQGLCLTRKQVDDLFLKIMKDDGIAWWRRTAAYYGVRIGGGSSWGAQPIQIVELEPVH